MLPAVLVSVGLHLGMVAVGFAAVSWGSNASVPLPVYTVALVDLPQSGPAPAGGQQAPPMQEEEVPPAPEPEADSPLKAVPEVPPEKKPEPAKEKTPPRPRPQIPQVKPQQQTATPPAATTETPEQPPAAGTEQAAPGAGLTTSGGGSVGGVPTIDSDAFSFGYYRNILTNRLRSTWSRPLVPGGLQQPIRATVQFVVLRSGAITDVGVQESSGYPPLDRSALRSVFDANPLPPLPNPYEGNRLAVTFFFELTPER
jgi:protein TonB